MEACGNLVKANTDLRPVTDALIRPIKSIHFPFSKWVNVVIVWSAVTLAASLVDKQHLCPSKHMTSALVVG